MQTLWRHMQEDLELVNGHLLDQVLRKSGILPKIVHKVLGTMLRKKWYWNSQKVDILFSVQRLSIVQRKIEKQREKEKYPYTSVLTQIQLIQFIELFFLSISSVSTEQWQLFAMNMKATKIARGNPFFWLVSQLFLEKSNPTYLLMMKNPETNKSFCSNMFNKLNSLSPENRLSKFCKEAGFIRVVEVGQYFVTRNAHEFQHTIACREYTLPRDDKASQPKGWGSEEIRELDLCWKSRQVFSIWRDGIEVIIESVNKDNSHSWVRISYGTVRYVNDYIKHDTQSLASPQEEDVPTSSGVVVARSKAKAKPQPRESTGATTIPLSERVWIDIEPSKQDLESYNLSKKVINLLRHNQKLHREEDGAIQFDKTQFHLRDHHLQVQNWSDDGRLAFLAAGGGPKRRYQYCSDYLGSIIYLRALQGHSGGNHFDLTLQDNVLIGPGIFPYIYHVWSNFNLSSIISNGLIPGAQNLSRRQSVFFLPIDPRKADHKDPEYIGYSVPRLARYLQNNWKRNQDTVFWIDIDFGIREGLKFYQTRSNAIIFQGTLPANCIVRAERWKNGEILWKILLVSSSTTEDLFEARSQLE